MSVRDLNAVGIQPDIILARAEKPLDQSRIKKLSISTGLEPEDIISAPDVKNVYSVPLKFEEQGLTDRILGKVGLKRKQVDLKEWRVFVDSVEKPGKTVKIGIVGKYFTSGDFSLMDSYISVIEAIKHASFKIGVKPEITWIDASKLHENPKQLSKFNGVIVPGGFGSRDVEGKIEAVKYVRGK
jgi:CTP synthase